jgi:hypothetical protein
MVHQQLRIGRHPAHTLSGGQTNLTWLDLSFNKITKIEGLDTLEKLVDLSLFNNQLAVIENLDALKDLNVLSLGADLVRSCLGARTGQTRACVQCLQETTA